MAATECVLRFFAFVITPYQQYNAKYFDIFLDNSISKMNEMSDEELAFLSQRFSRSMRVAWEIFGNEAFVRNPG